MLEACEKGRSFTSQTKRQRLLYFRFMKSKVILLSTLAIVSFATAKLYLRYRRIESYRVRICASRSISSALPILAEKLGLFKGEGINTEFEIPPLAKSCLESLIAGQVDFAVANVAPVVDAIIMANPITVITELQNSTHRAAVVYAADKNWTGPDSLIGKKIAVAQSTDAEMLLRLFIKEYPDLTVSNIRMVKTANVAESADLLERGVVQGAVLWDPYLSDLARAPQFVVQESAFYTGFSLLTSRVDFSSKHPEVVDRIVAALTRAQSYLEEENAHSKQIISRALGYQTSDGLNPRWEKAHFSMGLTSVLLAMMTEAASAFTTTDDHSPAETSAINVFQSLYPQALRKINHDLVTYE